MGLILGVSVIGALFLVLFVTIGVLTLYKRIQVRTNSILNNQMNYLICNLSFHTLPMPLTVNYALSDR